MRKPGIRVCLHSVYRSVFLSVWEGDTVRGRSFYKVFRNVAIIEHHENYWGGSQLHAWTFQQAANLAKRGCHASHRGAMLVFLRNTLLWYSQEFQGSLLKYTSILKRLRLGMDLGSFGEQRSRNGWRVYAHSVRQKVRPERLVIAFHLCCPLSSSGLMKTKCSTLRNLFFKVLKLTTFKIKALGGSWAREGPFLC